MRKLPQENNPILSVIILNYNAKDYLKKLIESIDKSRLYQHHIEIIVADNASSDPSLKLAKSVKINNPQIKYLFHSNAGNIGFAAGNNQGLTVSNPSSKYVLFLNPDTTVDPDTFHQMIEFFENDKRVDAATCNLILALTGLTQPECHRGFPTPWNAFCHFFGFGLPKLFPHSRFLNGYFLGYLDFSQIQPIDACVGAFFMLKRSVGDKVGWWNDQYFFYGEDLDFCWQLKHQGFSLYFYPNAKATHYQGVSSGGIGQKQKLSAASRITKVKVAQASTTAMRIFYKLNLINHYPVYLRWIVWLGIDLLEFYRVFKAKYL
jgi:GT2 family glycosyltransferase